MADTALMTTSVQITKQCVVKTVDVSTLKDLERRIEILQIHQDLDDQNKSVLAVSTIGGDVPSRHYYSRQQHNSS